MPKTTVYAELYCYGNLVAKGDWTGIKLELLLNQAEAQPQAKSIELTATDGYRVSISVALAQQPDVIVAYEIDGSALPETLRLVVPQANGDIWIAMIKSISLSISEPLNAGQSANTGAPVNTGQGPSLLPKQSLTPKQNQPVEPEPEQPKNETVSGPTPAPENTPQPTSDTPKQQDTTQTDVSGSLAEIQYGSLIAATATAVSIAGYMAYRRKTNKT